MMLLPGTSWGRPPAIRQVGLCLLALFTSIQAGQVALELPGWAGDIVRDMQDEMRMSAASFVSFRERLLEGILQWGQGLPEAKMDYPYYAFVPNLAAVIPSDGTEVDFSSPCFKKNQAWLEGWGTVAPRVLLRASDPTSSKCSDFYMFASTSSFHLEHVVNQGIHMFAWKVPQDVTKSELWDVTSKGVRIFRFTTTVDETLWSIFQTAQLFQPLLTRGVDPSVAAKNAAFIKDYAGFDLKPRDRKLNVAIDESDVKSGDMFLIVRMDGLDPLLAWGMGSTTGHVTMALWIEGELHVVESQTKMSYWPVDNVQRTPFKQWMEQATQADYNVLFVPLSHEYRSRFDEDKALAYFEQLEGLEYGYHNLLWGWVDTLKDNYPCLPPDYSRCLEWEFIEVAFALVDRHIPSIADLLWAEAFNLRLGTEGLRTSELWMAAAKRNITSQEVPVIVEQDSWVYHTTRYNRSNEVVGPSQVCCVLVCKVWKAAGVFGELADQINCGELTNADDYALSLFEGEYVQILGDRTMFLPRFNSQAPFAHMSERCPGLPPAYKRPAQC